MSKIGLFFSSLVAAVPAGFLAYLMVMNFLNRAELMKLPFQVLAGLTLALSAIVALVPFGVLIFSPGAGTLAGSKPAKKRKKDRPDEQDEEFQDEEFEGTLDEAEELDDEAVVEETHDSTLKTFAEVDDAEAEALETFVEAGDDEPLDFAEEEADFDTEAAEAAEEDFFDDFDFEEDEENR